MKPTNNWLEAIAAVALVFFAPVAAALLAVRSLLAGEWGALRPWAWVWAPLVVLWLVLALQGEVNTWLLLQAGVGLAFASVAIARVPRLFGAGLLAALTVAVAFGVVERELSRALWVDGATPQSVSDRIRGVTRLSGDSAGWRRNGVRLIEKSWRTDSTAEALELSFEAKLLAGNPGWQWYTNHPETHQELLAANDGKGTRITNPANERRYVVQRVRTDGPVAQRTFRATLELRAPFSTVAEGCDGLQIRTLDPIIQHCQSIALDESWREFTIKTRFPAEARQPAFELIINRINAPLFEVRNPRIEELRNGTWLPIEHVEPAGVQVRLPLEGVHIFSEPTLNFVPENTWQRHVLRLEGDVVSDLDAVQLVLQLEAGLEIALREVSMRAADGTPLAAAPLARLDLWFPHANLAGHALVAGGLLLLLLVRGPTLCVTSTALVLVAVFLTGSRAAWGAALVGMPWILWLRLAGRERLFTIAILAVAGAAMILGLGGDALGRLQLWAAYDDNPVTRVEIWHIAYQGFLEHPWTGVEAREGGFAAYWQKRYSGDSAQQVTHAHNVWLAFASSYGVPGLVAILWLTGGLLQLAWRWGRWRGFAVALPIFLMNFVDYTLFFPGVLLPMVFALNALRDPAWGGAEDMVGKWPHR